jgi:hypothetical protein
MATKNDNAWEKLFKDNNLLSIIQDKGIAYVTADLMKKYREPRLMAKIDTCELLPKVFKSNKLSILPIKNGEYAIFRDPHKQSFFKFPEDFDQIEVKQHDPSLSLTGFDSFRNLEDLNESQALDLALMSSIIKSFTNENKLWLTIRGRHFTRDFKVKIPSIQQYLDVSRVQIEIDAGYESENAIYIFEAKIGKRENFNVRQLLFPYLEWKNRTLKPVIPVFFFFTNGFYYLFQFDLGYSLDASRIVKQSCYTLSSKRKIDIRSLIIDSSVDKSLVENIPFPQANDLDKVIDTVSIVNQGYVDKESLSEVFEFDERQGDYYGNAARFLGFLDRKDKEFLLTNEGKRLIQLKSPYERASLVVSQLVMRPVFHQIFQKLLYYDLDFDLLDSINISQIIADNTALTGKTPARRASTVKQWIRWISTYAA